MDTITALGKVVDETTKVVDGLDAGDLAKPSPCEGWTVRDVLNHVTGGATMFAISAEQGSVPDDVLARIMGDTLGDDPKGAWADAARQAKEAFEIPGVLDKTVSLPFGEMPASMALDIAIADLAIHTCDIAQATGQQVGDTALFEWVLDHGRQVITDDFRMPGVLGPEQPAAAGAPVQERLLAFGGRRI